MVDLASMEQQLATWDWAEQGTEIAIPIGCVLHKQADGTWLFVLDEPRTPL